MKPSRYTKEKIYDLLPSIYRIRDKEQGEALKALLEIISEQVELVEQDIERLYNNWFIETCDKWVVPYIGDLLQARILNPVTSSTSNHRGWVATTISYRKRKGTFATIEQLSRDVTGWDCKIVEFFQNLITTQYLNHIRHEPKAIVDMRDSNKDIIELIGTPFDRSAHTLDVRNIDSKRGYYNVPNIGIFLWRLQAYPVIDAQAFALGEGKYTFSQLGYDLPIYHHPESETSIGQLVTELDVPTRIRRRKLQTTLNEYNEAKRSEKKIKFAYENSIKIFKTVLLEQDGNGKSQVLLKKQILPEDIVVCNLSKWHDRPSPDEDGKVAIDPEYGKILFPESERIVDVHVSYYYGFSGDIGGGFYDREESGEKEPILTDVRENFYHYKITKKNNNNNNNKDVYRNLTEAIDKWKTESVDDSRDVIFEIIDSETYTDKDTDENNNIIPIIIEIPANVSVIIKSQNLQRPVYLLNNPITVRGCGNGSRIIFDGILFVLASDLSNLLGSEQLYDNNNTILKITNGDLSELIINHCTFVPPRSEAVAVSVAAENEGINNNNNDNNNHDKINNNASLKISVNRSILGRIDSSSCDANLKIIDSIIDGKGVIDAIRCTSANIENATIFGKISSVILEYASNSIFTDILDIERRQEGCIRFCYIPFGSQIPRPYRCVLEYQSIMVAEESNIDGRFADTPATMNMKNKILRGRHIRPEFTSITYGDDGYGQLSRDVEKVIFEGGDNGSEMGAFNHQYNSHRLKNILLSINEYLKFGLEAGIFLVT